MQRLMSGLSLEQLIERMDGPGIERGFLIAHKSGRPGLPGCYHLPYDLVARAVRSTPSDSTALPASTPTKA